MLDFFHVKYLLMTVLRIGESALKYSSKDLLMIFASARVERKRIASGFEEIFCRFLRAFVIMLRLC